jgi:hypothetical protein
VSGTVGAAAGQGIWGDRVYSIVTVAWVGSLWVVGYLVAPVVFATLADRVVAGTVAGAIFSVEAKAGLACAAILLGLRLARTGAGAWREWPTRVIAAMALVTLVGFAGVAPLLAGLKATALATEGKDVMHSTLASRFAMWHGISSILFLIQSLLGTWLATSLRRAT